VIDDRPAPPLGAGQVADLLDELIFEQIIECVDLDALCRVERRITMLVGEVEGVPDDRIGELTTALLDRALLRLPNDVRRYLQATS